MTLLDDRALAHPPWGGPEPKQPEKVDLPLGALEAMLDSLLAGIDTGRKGEGTEALIDVLVGVMANKVVEDARPAT